MHMKLKPLRKMIINTKVVKILLRYLALAICDELTVAFGNINTIFKKKITKQKSKNIAIVKVDAVGDFIIYIRSLTFRGSYFEITI